MYSIENFRVLNVCCFSDPRTFFNSELLSIYGMYIATYMHAYIHTVCTNICTRVETRSSHPGQMDCILCESTESDPDYENIWV